MFLEVIERHLQIFWKNVNFKVLVVFWKLKLCCPRIRVEWFNTFWNFQKAIHSWRSGIFYESNSKKIGEFGRPQSLHFQTITGTFKKIFWKLYRYLPNTSKNKRQNRKFEIKCFFNILYFIPKLAETVFDLNNSKQKNFWASLNF